MAFRLGRRPWSPNRSLRRFLSSNERFAFVRRLFVDELERFGERRFAAPELEVPETAGEGGGDLGDFNAGEGVGGQGPRGPQVPRVRTERLGFGDRPRGRYCGAAL